MDEASLSEHICGLEEKLLTTEVRTSPHQLSLLLAEDFFEYGSSGTVWYKKDMMGEEGGGDGGADTKRVCAPSIV